MAGQTGDGSRHRKVVFGARLPGNPHEVLDDSFLLVLPEGEVASQEELEQELGDAWAVVSLLSHQFGEGQFDRAPLLRLVSNYAVGYNNVDVAEATRRGILVTNTPDVLTETTADLTWALLLAAARRVVEGDRFVRAGRFQGWAPSLFLGRDVHHRTLGLVGFGRIGRAVARRAQGFGMRVLFYDPAAGAPEGLTAEPASFDALLAESDFLSIHCPLTPQTRHLVDESALRAMKPTAVLVNTARGPVVDEAALVRALREGWIAAAGLDVYEREPELADGLAELSNVVLTPHVGSASHETRQAMARLAVEAVLDLAAGRRPAHPVNPEVLEGGTTR